MSDANTGHKTQRNLSRVSNTWENLSKLQKVEIRLNIKQNSYIWYIDIVSVDNYNINNNFYFWGLKKGGRSTGGYFFVDDETLNNSFQ